MICPVCQTEFKRNSNAQKYCKPQCSDELGRRKYQSDSLAKRRMLSGISEWIAQRHR